MTSRYANRYARARGFTLIELMITTVVIAILASIAIPSYNSQIRKSRRTEARNALLDLAGREERLFSTTNAYSKLPEDLGYSGTKFPQTIGSGYYTITVELDKPAVGGFRLTAAPITGKGQDKDSKCQAFIVTNTGSQSAKDSSSGDATSDCWG